LRLLNVPHPTKVNDIRKHSSRCSPLITPRLQPWSSTVWDSSACWTGFPPTDRGGSIFAVVQDGLIKSLRLTHTGARSFFTLPELMAANLRSLLSAYAGLWAFPAPTEVPTALRDPDVRFELRRRLASVQLDLFAHLPVVA